MRFVSLLVLAAACSPDLPKQTIVDKLRVLAVRAEPAELVLGGSPPAVAFTALAVDASGAAISLQWALCPLPANIAVPVQLDCPGVHGIPLQGERLDLAASSTRPLWDALFSAADGTAMTEAQKTALLATGTTVVVGFSAHAAGESLSGFTRVPLRNGGAAVNHNPALQALLVNGAEVPADGSFVLNKGLKVRLKPVPASDAKELTPTGPEALNFSFFATGGDVDSLRSADQTATGEAVDPSIDYTAPQTAGPLQLWVVVRDGRGGVGWLTRTVQVR